ncbi:MAG: VCBS domain-containing protein [Endomicrobiaceae bacterium]|nr:VCBS domain-containing protein [Endomicrobiaceae bacterium]
MMRTKKTYPESKLRKELYNYVLSCIDSDGISDDAKFDAAIRDMLKVLDRICSYIEKHGTISLTCGGEWMYQDDDGQVDALELVSDILDSLSDYAERDDDTEW